MSTEAEGASATLSGPRSLFRRLADKLLAGPAGATFKGMATIASGNMVARLIGVVATPLLTRIYSPESFGILAIFASIVAFLGPIMTLRYVVAVPLPKNDAMAMNVVALAVAISLVMSAVLTLMLWAAGPLIFPALNAEAIAPYWWLIVIALIGSAVFEVLSMWATRKRQYRLMAQATVVQSVGGAATKLVLGLLSMTTIGLILGQIVNQSGGISSFIKRFHADFRANISRVSRRRIWQAAGVYRGFPVYRLPSQFILIFAQQAPTVFVAALYGVAVAGQLAVAQMLVSLPVNLLSTALTKAAYGELAAIGKNKPEQVKEILKKITSTLFLVSAAVAAGVFVLAPTVLPIVLGAEWHDAGILASSLSVYLVAAIIAVPMSAFVNIFDRQGEFLIWNIVRAVLVGSLIAATAYLQISVFLFISLYGFLMLAFQAGVIARTNAIVASEVRKKQRRAEA
jgi:O-antigen/teichoic acid export membrane protein